MSSKTFPPSKRLVERDVRAILRSGRRVAGSDLELKYLTRPASETFGGARLAIAVPKRRIKRAVARNRIKRMVRECFRLHRISGAPHDLLITYKSAVTPGIRLQRMRLRKQLESLFADALRKTETKREAGSTA